MNNLLSPMEAQALIASGRATLIDVREPDEFRSGHIPYALSVPLAQVAQVVERLHLADDALVIFQCQKGGRGERACDAVPPQLSGRVRNLAGGLDAWRTAGLPVTGTAPDGISIFRQVQIGAGTLVLLGVLLGAAGFAPGYYAAGFFGFMLVFAGWSGWCGMALLLQRMPWNRAARPA